MLGIKWFMFFFGAIAICGLLSGFISGGMGQAPPWGAFMATWEQVQSFEGFILHIPALTGGFFSLLWNTFSWNYSFLDGSPWIYFKWFLLFPISAAFAVSLMIMFVGMVRGSGT